MPDLMDEFETQPDLMAEFEAVTPAAPPARPRQQTGALEAAGRGAAQGFTVGFGDEVTGLVQAAGDAGLSDVEAIQRALSSGDWGELKNRADLGRRLEKFLSTYRATRDHERSLNTQAAEDQPGAYGLSMVAGALPLSIATGGAGLKGVVASSAAQGLGSSTADVTRGEVGEALDDTVLSGGFSALGARMPGARYAMPAAGLGLAAFGDKLGMSAADRVAAGAGAALALPGLVGDGLESLAARTRPKAQGARQQLTRELERADLTEDAADGWAMNRQADAILAEDAQVRRDAIARVRAQEREANATARAETREAKKTERRERLGQEREELLHREKAREEVARVRQEEATSYRDATARARQESKQAQLAGLDEQEQAVRARREHDTKARVAKDYEGEARGANREYERQMGEWDAEIAALEKVRAGRGRERARLEDAVRKAEAELVGLGGRAEGAEAQAYQTLDVRARRAAETYERRGLEVPQDVLKARDFVDDSYLATTGDKLVYPEDARKRFIAQHKPAYEAALAEARGALKAHTDAPFDEEQAVGDMLGKKGYRVSKNEAYQLARRLGLDVGDFETFEPRPPQGGWKLTKPAPDAPNPLPDPAEGKLARIQKRRAALEKGSERPVRERAPESEILGRAGLEVPLSPGKRRLASLERRLKALDEGPEAPVRQQKPEADILREAGLDKPRSLSERIDPVGDPNARVNRESTRPGRVDEIVERAGPEALGKVREGALKGAAPGGVAMGLLPFKSAGAAATVVGGAMGARGALRQLSRIDPKTGDYKNPAAVAAVMESLERVLMKYPNLGKKYLAGFRKGLSPVQAMFYIDEDAELARALDEDAAEQQRRGPVVAGE